MRIALFVAALATLAPAAARAQTPAPSPPAPGSDSRVAIEAGVGASHGCHYGCDGEVSSLMSLSASIWFDDRLQIQQRFGQGPLPNLTFDVPRDGRFPPNAPDRVKVFIEGRRLRFITTSAVWLFRRGERVRPMLGVGVGTLTIPRRSRCEPVGCEPLLELLAGPPRATAHNDLAFTVGLSVRATERLSLRFGASLHNPAGEELSAEELFAEVAWRVVRWR